MFYLCCVSTWRDAGAEGDRARPTEFGEAGDLARPSRADLRGAGQAVPGPHCDELLALLPT